MSLTLPRTRANWRVSTAFALAAALACAATVAQTPPTSVPLTLERAVQAGAAQSRGLAAERAMTQSAREMAVAAGQLPDPVLKLGLNNLPLDGPDRFSITRDFMTMRAIGVMQEFTRADKRSARVVRAQREVQAATIAEQQTLAELQRDTALAWLERSFQQSTREVLQAQQAQAELQVQAAETLYRSGRGMQTEVFMARVQVEQLHDRILQSDRQIAVAQTQLARWIGDAASQPLAPRPAFVTPAWARTEAGELASHLARHPLIAAAVQQEALAEADTQIARAAKQSDWSAELMLAQRGPAFSRMLSLNFSVPLQWDPKNRQDRELASRLALLERTRARREDMQRAHEAEVRTMQQERASHDERARRYDAVQLPLAEQRSTAALTAYRSGSGTLPAVLEARRNELELRLERLRIESDIARLWAQLTYLMPADDAAARTTP